jgi:fermentation-respiration switch protein FrsA (DUF1100 family)
MYGCIHININIHTYIYVCTIFMEPKRFYTPASKAGTGGGAPLPLILISHGLGGQKDMGLEGFAIPFVEAGFASLVIDYRYVMRRC